jgi:hypothetical protein
MSVPLLIPQIFGYSLDISNLTKNESCLSIRNPTLQEKMRWKSYPLVKRKKPAESTKKEKTGLAILLRVLSQGTIAHQIFGIKATLALRSPNF